jgi:hypothetical protein
MTPGLLRFLPPFRHEAPRRRDAADRSFASACPSACRETVLFVLISAQADEPGEAQAYRSFDGSLRVRSLIAVPCIVRRAGAAGPPDTESPVAPPDAMRTSCLRARSCSGLRRLRSARTSAKSGRSLSSLAYLLATLASLTYQSTKALASYLFWAKQVFDLSEDASRRTALQAQRPI